MSLSIGVVSVRYLDEPAQPVLDFAEDLRFRPSIGIEEYYQDLDSRDEDDPLGDDESEDEYWEDGGFCEFRRIGMIRRATGWAIHKTLPLSEKAILLDWVANLPWNGDFIMLHLAR